MFTHISLSVFLRAATVVLIGTSIFVTYYVMVIQQDYTIFTNPDGPETDDYFEELFAT